MTLQDLGRTQARKGFKEAENAKQDFQIRTLSNDRTWVKDKCSKDS